MEWHWWYIPVWFLCVFVTGYLWGASQALGRNDFKDGAKKR